MSTSVSESATIPGPAMKMIGGAMLALAILVAIWSVFSGDLLTGAGVLIYIPAGALLLGIGQQADLV